MQNRHKYVHRNNQLRVVISKFSTLGNLSCNNRDSFAVSSMNNFKVKENFQIM